MTIYSTKETKIRISRDCSDREAWHQPYCQQQIKLLERAEDTRSLKTRENHSLKHLKTTTSLFCSDRLNLAKQYRFLLFAQFPLHKIHSFYQSSKIK
ncbi:MAG: hypothetical protein F6K23_24525 [Okeania sp. SIO2C9]|uniref:hypothetical protein n=1 Tax=Okeania sp. SIO2C9 TaxID=2607791 RepID=UPI0013BF018C|nr:hypothetical protein [Okeania sp. SIO2C9]NEQ75919.1 hypothetical protein [Okeania sp. SIO2C9]